MKLFNVNCLEKLKAMPSNSVDLVVTDPPYKLTTGNGKMMMNRKYIKQIGFMANGFSLKILDQLLRVMKKLNIYIFCSRAQLPILWQYFDKKSKLGGC